MKRGRPLLAWLSLLIAAVALAVIALSCGGKAPPAQSPVVSGQPSDDTWGPSASAPGETSLSEALSDLDDLPTPEGVDESLFSALKSALREALLGSVGRVPGGAPSSYDAVSLRRGTSPAPYSSSPLTTAKLASRPPTGEANKVDDLELTDNGDGTYALTWSYRNVGDYNQDGIVNIMDLTPLAAHFNEEADSTNEWIDGSGDGAIDVGDVIPLAANFFCDVAGYAIEGATVGGDFSAFNTVDFPVGAWHAKPLQLTFPFSAGDAGSLARFRVVPVDSWGESGIPSNEVELAPGRGDWWMFGHDSQHTHRSPFAGPQSGNFKWKFDTGAVVYSSPAIGTDGTIYVGTWGDYFYAINPDGTLKWRCEGVTSAYSSPAIGADGTIYVGTFDNYLYAINPEGTVKWRYETARSIYSSPAIGIGGTVYVGGDDSFFYAVNPDGTLKWRYKTGWAVNSSSAIAQDGTLCVGSEDGCFYAVNPDGTLKWKYEAEAPVYSSPAIGADGAVYVGSEYGDLYAVCADGTLKWSYEMGQVLSSPAIAADGTIYVGSCDQYLYAINPNGAMRWKYETAGFIFSSPAIGGGGTVYLGSSYYVYALNPDGTLKWRYSAGSSVLSSPSIGADGTVYVGSADGYLYAFAD